MLKSKKTMAAAVAGVMVAVAAFAGIGQAQAGLSTGVAHVSGDEAAGVQGGCTYYGWTEITYIVTYYGCGGPAKTMPTTTSCPKTAVLILWGCTNYGDVTSEDCYECGKTCGTRQGLAGCGY